MLLSSSIVGIANASPWPVAVVDQASTKTQQAISIPVIANDIGSGLELTEVNTTTKRLGSASINADKQSITYRSAIGFVGVDTFWYVFKDNQGRTNAAKVTVTVAEQQTQPPQWPTAGYESPQIKYNKPTEIEVLDNDQGVGLTITSVNTTTVKLGSVSISADGQKLLYTPRQNYVGNDEFWYVFRDAWGRTNAGKVTPVVLEEEEPKPPQWPTAGYESPEIKYNKPTEIAVLGNDQGVGLTITSVNTTTVKLGSVSISSDGQKLLYTPPQDYAGNDEFWYVFRDSWGRTNAGKVTPVVLEEESNSPWPTATPDYASTVSTQSIAIPVLKNDVGDELKLLEVNATTVGLGKASIINGYIRYIPPVDFSGQDSFWYNFEDKDGRKNSTQVFVDVTKNTQLSSVEFCGANYFTDGTLENTNTSSNTTDPNAVELDTSVSIEPFVSPTGALAIIGDRRYLLETNAQGKQLVVEENGQRTVLQAFSQDEIYGVGVRNNTFFFAVVPEDSFEREIDDTDVGYSGYRNHFLSHDGVKLQKIGSYLLQSQSQKIEMMQTQESTLIRFTGYENIGEGPAVVPITFRGQTNNSHQYHEIIAEDGKAMYLGSNKYYSDFGNSWSRSEEEKVFSYDQHLISSVKTSSQQGAFPGPTGYYFRSRTSAGLVPDAPSARLDKAVLSNNRLLLTTIAHQNTRYTGGNGGGITNFPAKLYSFDSSTGKFIALATCN